MSLLNGILANGTAMSDHRPWPRAIVDEETWKRAATDMAEGRLSLLGLWGEAHLRATALKKDHLKAQMLDKGNVHRELQGHIACP